MCGLKTGQRRDVRGQRRDVTERIYANIATFGATSRRSGQRRDVPETGTKQRRDVGYQRRDIPETAKNQRHVVEIACRDVPESVKFNVATLEINVATFQGV